MSPQWAGSTTAALDAGEAVQVQVVSSPAALHALVPQWSELLARCPEADLFAHPAWHVAWWTAFGDGGQPHVLAFRDAGRLIGVMPLMRYRDRLRGLPARVLGSYNNEHASRTGLLAERGHEVALGRALAHHLKTCAGEWDVLMLRQLPAGTAWLRSFVDACAVNRLAAFGPTPGIGKCVLSLTEGWSGFMSGKSRHFRRRLKENERRLERAGRVTYRRSDGSAEDFEHFQRLEERSWKGEDGHASLGAAGWSFQRDVALNTAAGVSCHNLFLELDGQVVGGVHAVAFRGVAYSLQTLFDESVRALYAGRVQFGVHVQDMFESGRHRVLDLNGNSPFCKSWTDQELSFVGLQVFNHHPYSALLGRLKRLLGRRR
ncbi:GNAT family N-acetyltransferase [Aquabacterium sp. J223]|uniref:GNAT family N-acetyltransferase n=1 Tax=Aquabacterium sp. J223 TaxID=2898431 RepID=UPI0021ADEC84|nr:GNAT family N-acetyltransferase [Aquabacterium sp. J223]UUX94803.1 GNAT family N-acetyltransferase [Aquabacterium sp. J223]